MVSIEPRPVLSGRTIEREIVIQATPERVFRALTERAELANWFVTRAEGAVQPGQSLRYVWEGEGEVDGRYLAVEAPSRLVYEWYNDVGVTRVTIELAPEAGGTRLRLSEIGYGEGEDWDALYEGESSGWGPLLDALRQWVESGVPTHHGPSAQPPGTDAA